MNTNYCRISSPSALTYAPDFLVRADGSLNHSPTRAEYAAQNWLKNAVQPPSPPEGYVLSSTTYEARGEGETGEIVAVYAYSPAPTVYRKFSKLKIYGAIVSLPDVNGTTAWNTIKSWLEGKDVDGVNGWMAFQLAQEISEENELFAAWSEEARQLLGLTTEQFEALLAQCVLED